MTQKRPAEVQVDYMNRSLKGRDFTSRLSLRVRQAHFALFMEHLRPDDTTRVLDIGVTADNDLREANFFEKLYPYPANITATGIEDASRLEELFPGLKFVAMQSSRLPFADKAFDVAFSSAVIEHVGNREQQRQFLEEMLRVADAVFFTTPNRWFPIELHSALPFLHWLPQRVHQRLLSAIGQGQWASTEHLNLLSPRSLRSLFPSDARFVLHRHRLCGWCSNLVVWSN